MVELSPVAHVSSEIDETVDDYWGGRLCTVTLTDDFEPSAFAGLDSFSHVEVIFLLDRVVSGTEERGSRRPRNNPDWPEMGIFAQRAKRRPNRLAVSRARVVELDGRRLVLEGLDAIDGTPVLDIKPWMDEFGPRGETRQPPWATTVMSDYYRTAPQEP